MKNLKEIPFLNLPQGVGWGTKFQQISDFYKGQKKLKNINDIKPNRFIEIEDVWSNIEFRAWLEFNGFFKKLNRVVLGIPRKDSYKNQTVDDFINNYNLLVRCFGEPTLIGGLSLEELKQIEDIQEFESSELPFFKWVIGETKVVLRYFDHWGITFEIFLAKN